MKNLYFGSAVAMLAILASCSQDELGLVAEKPASADLAGRKTVGVVTFVTNETRFDYEAEHAEAGDVLGVYLMDRYNHINYEWNDETSWPNANTTDPYSNSQWWTMYSMTNYISTNFSYAYDGSGNWENKQAELIEGNYIATYPRCEKATNRRDLWHQFEAERVLEKKTAEPWVIDGRENVYTNFDNTFYVGYKRIYRDDEDQHAGANLKEDIKLHNVTTDAHFVIADYDGGTNYRIKKVSIRRKDGQQVPTLVYVRPEAYDKATAADLGIYKNKFDQNTARSITKFTNIPDASNAYDYVPYKYDEREPVYEYSFLLPEADGFEMNASSAETEGRATSDRLDVYMRIPCDDLHNYTIEIYADQWVKEGVTRHWEEGVFYKGKVTGTDNGDWTLDKVLPKLSHEGETIPMGYLRFDNSCWQPYKDYGVVMNQDHLWEKLNSGKDRKDAITASSLKMDVILRGEPITLDQDVMDFLVKENIYLRFVGKASDNQKIYLTAAELCDHVIANDYDVIVPEGVTSSAAAEPIVASVFNYGTFTTQDGTVLDYVNNSGTFNFSGNVADVVNNEGATINANKATCDYLYNNGTLNAKNLTVLISGSNDNTINANGNVNGETTLYNTQYGTINVNAGTTTIADNEGYINVTASGATVSVNDNFGSIDTKGKVKVRNVEGGKINIIAKISDIEASVIFDETKDVVNSIITNDACANVENQPVYSKTEDKNDKMIKNEVSNLNPASVANYNHNGGLFSVLNVSDCPFEGTIASWVKEANIQIDKTVTKNATLNVGSATKTILTGTVIVQSGKEWTLKGDNIDATGLLVYVVDGGKFIDSAASGATVKDFNLDK